MHDSEGPQPGDVTFEPKRSESALDAERGRTGRLDEIASSMKELAQKLPGSINRALESAQTALSNRANAITIHVDDESQRRIDQLVEAGVFRNRSESAAFLIAEGIRARQELFTAIGTKIAEIDRLRSEMRALVTHSEIHDPTNPT